jgi:UDP-N-acetylmuramyl pentapeptide phosphotransferase/UDP-N-acetylglucosamine-1-phosphate transferase
MGDCGSLFIGAVIAGASLTPVRTRAVPWTALLIVVILVVPLFDTAFVLVLRRWRAERDARRHGSRLTSARVARFLGAERRADLY